MGGGGGKKEGECEEVRRTGGGERKMSVYTNPQPQYDG